MKVHFEVVGLFVLPSLPAHPLQLVSAASVTSSYRCRSHCQCKLSYWCCQLQVAQYLDSHAAIHDVALVNVTRIYYSAGIRLVSVISLFGS